MAFLISAILAFSIAGVPLSAAEAQANIPASASSRSTMRLPIEQSFRVLVDSLHLRVLVYHHRPTRRGIGTGHAPVLFVHGSSFPSALAAGFRFDGVSWLDDLAARGFDVWALDFLGYGGSDRYAAMRDAPFANPPLGRAPDASRQILAAAQFITARTRASRVSIVAHSWGTIPAGLFAEDHPTLLDRLVDFGPVAQRYGKPDTTTQPAFAFVTEDEQRARFDGYVPVGEPHVLDPRHFAVWGPAYMATDSSSESRSPASVEVPNGPSIDVGDAWSGHLGYDPGRIQSPVLIIRGEWDVVTRDADAHWLWDALSHAPLKRDIKISRATHVMHLESARYQLYYEVAEFLAGGDSTAKAATRGPQPSARPDTERTIQLVGLGASRGPAQSFSIDTAPAARAAVNSMNERRPGRLHEGGRAKLAFRDDDRCTIPQRSASCGSSPHRSTSR